MPRSGWLCRAAPGGKAVYATTDRSGAFTLRGLHQGTSYAVIAEYLGEDGIKSGARKRKLPRLAFASASKLVVATRLKVTHRFSRLDPALSRSRTSIRWMMRSRMRAVPTAESTPKTSPYLPLMPPHLRLGGTCGSRERAMTIRPLRPGRAGARDKRLESMVERPLPVRKTRATRPHRQQPNPTTTVRILCPPHSTPQTSLREIRPTCSMSVPSRWQASTRSGASTRSLANAGRKSASSDNAEADDKAIGIMANVGEREPGSMPDDIVSRGKMITPASSAPIVLDEKPDDDGLPARSARGTRRSPVQSAGRQTNAPDETDASGSPEPGPAAINGASSAADRPTWAEVGAKSVESTAR